MKTKDTIAITSVKIEIAGTTLNLTLDQARQLKEILESAFPKKETVYIPTYVDRTVWPTYDRPFWQPSWITCGATNAGNAGCENATTLLLSAT
jgi:hypothetical protein